MRGEIARAVVNSSEKEAQKVLEKYIAIFGPEHMFIEIQRNAKGIDETKKEIELNNKLINLARANNIRLVATADSHYIYPEDSDAQDVLVCIGTGKTVHMEDRLDMRSYDLSLKSEDRMRELFSDVPEAVDNTQLVVDMCDLDIPTNQRYFANVELPEGKTAEQHMRDTVYGNALPLYGVDGQLPQHVVDRIEYELDVICKKGFAPYFIMVADIVAGAQSIGAITNTRGSAAGSIVGRILNISRVDPLYYQLPFERFLNPYRPTPPDVDLDISDNRRDEVIAWITKRYGHDKVAQIITFGTMQARAAVRDVGRALGIPYSKCDQISKMIPIGKQGTQMTIDKALEVAPELKEIYTRDPDTNTVLNIAKKLEGGARHASIHAAAIAITPTPLTDYTPLQKEPDGERMITQYDMYSLDAGASSKAIGVIKMDLLGIRNLSILEAAVRIAEARHGVTIDIYNLPHPDEKTLKLLSDGLTFGVFQLASSGMTRYLKELKPKNIFDIMAMIALYRPGPMSIIPEYIARQHGRSPVEYFDPRMKAYMERSLGLLVYQDDVLLTAVTIAGYTWEEADKFRKAMGKKIPEEMAKQKVKFIDGCVKSGMRPDKAGELFAQIEPFAAYGFGRAHAASYSTVSYQTAYMKAHYPVEFMAALMSAESGDEDKIYAAVEECKLLGIKVLPPDLNESRGDFTVVDDQTIRFGFNAIKNLGSDVVDKIMEVRGNPPGKKMVGKNSNNQVSTSIDHQMGGEVYPAENTNRFLTPSSDSEGSKWKQEDAYHPFTSLEDFFIRAHTRNMNKKSWEALAKAGALDAFGERGQLLANTEEVLDFTREHFKAENSGQNSLFGKSLTVGRLRLREVPPATMDEMLVWEKEILGFFVSAHPLDNYREVLKSFQCVKDLGQNDLGRFVTMGGIISRLKKMLTKKNDPMAFFSLQDLTGTLEAIVFPKVMEKAVPLLVNDKIVQVSGRISDKEEDLKLIVDEIKELPSDQLYFMALSEMEKNKQVVLHMNTVSDKEILETIRDIVQNYPGNAQVYLSIGSGPHAKRIKTQTQVRISNELLRELRNVSAVHMVDVN
jgi:DNA polymerase III subunit alpha